LKLESCAFARGDASASLANTSKRNWDFFSVAARHAIREDVDVISLLKQVKRGLQHTDV
jgi:hypothetical protein